MNDETGSAAGRYQRIVLLGQGGMARVFLTVARGPAGFNKLLVVKELRPELTGDADVRTMFMDEARLAAKLNHPNVVHTYEVGQDGGQYFLAMEYLEGQSLSRFRARIAREKLPLEAYLRILAEALAGLHYAHELADFDGAPLNVVHRDVSPANIFVTYDGQIKVVDFGIAKSRGAEGHTKFGVFKGTASYASPEQVLGGDVDRRADVFSVGILLWEAIAEERFWGEKPALTKVLLKLSQGDFPHLRDVNPDVPERLLAICQRAIALAPSDRYATAAEFQLAIEDYLASCPVQFSRAQIGRALSEHFEPRRAEIRGLVDAQLKRISTEPERATHTTSIPVVAPDAESSQPSAASGQSASIPAGPATATRSGALRWAAFGAGAVGLAVAGILLWAAQSKPAATSAATVAADPAPVAAESTPALAVSAEAPAPATELVTLEIKTDPAEAELFLDGVKLASNPFRSTLPKDGASHRLRATAAGYANREETLSFASPVRVSLALSRLPPRGAYIPGPRAAKPAAIPQQEASRKPEPEQQPELRPARPKRSVDENDPYSR